MKSFVTRISQHPRFSKATEWAKLISVTGSVQLLIQGISVVSGILIVNLLPKGDEYAYYTMANNMLGTMVVLADGGISTGVMAQGAKVWLDRTKLGAVIMTGLDLRRKFAAGSVIIATPVLVYLLRMQGASWLTTILILGALMPAFLFSLTGNLLEIVARIRQDIIPLQKTKVVTNIGRLGLLSGFIFFFPFAYLAILASAIPQLWANRRMRKNGEQYADFSQKPDPHVRHEILGMVKRILPGAIYFSVSGQITIWLISVFGHTSSISEAGALGRLSMILTTFTVLFNTLVTPRFARLPNDSNLLRNRYVQIIGALFVMGLGIVGLFRLFPSEILWILGKQYANLTTEVVYMIIGSCLSLIAGCAYSLYSNRGWAMNPFIGIPIGILAIICATLLMKDELGTLIGIIKFDIFVNTVAVTVNVSYGLLKIVRSRKAEARV